MRDVIQKIVATENEAKRAIEEARAQADRIIFDARMQAQDITAKALQDASGEASRIVEEATVTAENKQQEILMNAVARIDSQVHIDESLRKQIVDDIIKLVCGRHP